MRCLLLALVLLVGHAANAAEPSALPAYPRVRVETNLGNFELELDGPRAPISVFNFVEYVRQGAYDGTLFHRVISGFMIQGGGFDTDYQQLPARGVIPNESGNGRRNERGTIAMARVNDPHSASRQFFINLVDNPSLDPRTSGWGYAVFGRVAEGMETVDKIAAVPTGPGGRFPGDVPQSPVIIQRMSIVEGAEP